MKKISQGWRRRERRRRYRDLMRARPISTLPLAAIAIDPERFQYKLSPSGDGSTRSLSSVTSWNFSAEGVLDVWLDPSDRQTYVVNGHNRLALARRLGIESLPCRYLASRSWQEARRDGAIANLAQGCGTVLDAAKMFRDGSMGKAAAKSFGLSLASSLVRDGLAIATLPRGVFSLAVSGVVSAEHAAVLGTSGLSADRQIALVKALGGSRHLSRSEFSELVSAMSVAAFETSQELTLFGTETFSECLLLETAKVQAFVRTKLSKDRHALKSAARNKATLEAEGSRINALQSTKASDAIASSLETFDRLKSQPGAIASAIASAAKQLRAGKPLEAIVEPVLRAIEAIAPPTLQTSLL